MIYYSLSTLVNTVIPADVNISVAIVINTAISVV